MRIRFTITLKLLLLVLPLVCLPVAIVGYFSYDASVERMTRLSCEEQTMRVQAAAAEINNIFKSCRMDLETITVHPIIEDYYYNMIYQLEAEAEDSRKKIVRLFRDFIARSPYYFQIRFLDQNDREVVCFCADGGEKQPSLQRTKVFFEDIGEPGEHLNVSEITFSLARQGFVVYFAKPFVNIWGEFSGEIIIDLDYDKVIKLVKSIRVGEKGYAFLVDQSGQTIAHPKYKPYEYGLANYPDPSLREFVYDMMKGETGWKTYNHFGEKAAAYAPISAMGWSLAVNVPIEEFKKEAKTLRKRVLEMVVVTLLLAGLIISVLSYHLMRPVRRLAAATKRIAKGDLSYEIPITSGDELGALTSSFNSMVKNLRDIQSELVRSEKLVSLGRLSAGVAHEIRNPLNAMKGAMVYLQRRKSHDTLIQEYTQLILEEIDRLNEFVTEFLYFARQSPPNLAPIDINELIQNTLNLFEEKLHDKGILVVKNPDVAIPFLSIDAHQMEQVLVNLLLNAIDAMPDGGNLELSASIRSDGEGAVSSNTALITLKDDGTGIPSEYLQNIFDPFFSTKETGTGLGLPISLGIVENHKGKLRILSKEGEGTKAIIELTVSKNHAAKEVGVEKKDPNR